MMRIVNSSSSFKLPLPSSGHHPQDSSTKNSNKKMTKERGETQLRSTILCAIQHNKGCEGRSDNRNIHLTPIVPTSNNCDQEDHQYVLDHIVFDPPETLERLGSLLNPGRGHIDGDSLLPPMDPPALHNRHPRHHDCQPLLTCNHGKRAHTTHNRENACSVPKLLRTISFPSCNTPANSKYCFVPPPVCSPAMTDTLFPLPTTFRPGPYSVIIGRGGTANKCAIGNRRLRVIASTFLRRYSNATTKGRKSNIVSTIVNMIKEACPNGGAFIRLGKDGRWYEAKDTAASEKVGYTLREMLGEQYKSSSKSKGRRRQGRQHNARTAFISRSSNITTATSSSSSSDDEDVGHEENDCKKNLATNSSITTGGSKRKSTHSNHSAPRICSSTLVELRGFQGEEEDTKKNKNMNRSDGSVSKTPPS